MNENEFEYNGKMYVTTDSDGNCDGCHLVDSDDCLYGDRPACTSSHRSDGRYVIFVEKQS